MTHNNNDFVYQLEPLQSIVKVLIYKMESGIGDENKHEYESKNENDKMLQKTQERLDQTSVWVPICQSTDIDHTPCLTLSRIPTV